MQINWFPGHMTKSLRMMDDNIRQVDAVIYVLDARAPLSCINPELNKVIAGKPVIYVLNKADLVPEQALSEWIKRFTATDTAAVKIQATASKSSLIIIEKLKKLCAPKIERKRAKGINAVLRAMVIGVPNTGKSTIINNLCGKAKTMTGNKAGVTRGKQWVRIDGSLDVLDTPGTLYPKLDDQHVALNLAFIGSIRDEVVDTYELSLELVKKLKLISPDSFFTRYNISEIDCTDFEMLEKIAKQRGFVIRGGEPDVERASAAFIDDFRKGRLGKIILESVI